MREEGIKETFESHLGLIGSACDIETSLESLLNRDSGRELNWKLENIVFLSSVFFSVWFFQDGNGCLIGS